MNTNALIIYKKNYKGILNGNNIFTNFSPRVRYLQHKSSDLSRKQVYLYINGSKRKESDIVFNSYTTFNLVSNFLCLYIGNKT